MSSAIVPDRNASHHCFQCVPVFFTLARNS